MRISAGLLAFGFLAISPASGQEVSAQPAVKISHFSGKPVPRFESLKFSAVHGRVGPSLDHPIAWKYERTGLPVLIIKESREWRFVRDPDGDEVWVHSRMLSGARTALVRADAELKRLADTNAESVALLKAGVVAELHGCSGSWCAVSIERREGYLPRQLVWGGETSEAGL